MKAACVKVNETDRQVKNAWIKVNGDWKQRVMPKGKISGSWKELMSYGRYNIYYTYSLSGKLLYRVVDPSYNITDHERTLTIPFKNPTDGYIQLLGMTHINPSEGIVAFYITTNRSSNRNDLIIIADLINGTVLKQWETQKMLGVQVKSWSLKSNGNIISIMYETFNDNYVNLKVFDLNLNVIKDVLIGPANGVSDFLLRRDGGIYFIYYGRLRYMDSNYQLKKEITLPPTNSILKGIDKNENVYTASTNYNELSKYSPELELLSSNTSSPENTYRFIDHDGKIVEELWSYAGIKRKNFDGSLLWERRTSTGSGSFYLDTNGNYIRYSGGEVIGSAKGNVITTLPTLNVNPLSIQGNFI